MNDYGEITNYNIYGTSYGLQSGGGFIGGNYGSQGAKELNNGSNKRSSGNTLRPVMIKQILEASQQHPDAEFKVDGTEIGQLTFVAVVRNISIQSTNITYRMEDGTGLIEVKQWLEMETITDDNPKKNIDITPDTYVRVIGQLKSFNNKRHIYAHHIRPISDLNEVQYHILETTAIHLYFTRGPPQNNDSSKPFTTIDRNSSNYGIHDPMNINEMLGAQFSLRNLSPYLQKVMAAVHAAPNTNEGVNIHQLAKTIGGGNIERAIEELTNDGLLYTTIDDEHVSFFFFFQLTIFRSKVLFNLKNKKDTMLLINTIFFSNNFYLIFLNNLYIFLILYKALYTLYNLEIFLIKLIMKRDKLKIDEDNIEGQEYPETLEVFFARKKDKKDEKNWKKTELKDKKRRKTNISSFESMGISLNTLKAIKYKGFKIPTPIQRKTISLLLDHMDVVAMARTGSGKTAAFVIPMIERLKTHQTKVGSRALILSPNRELALQTIKVVKELKRGTNLKAVLLVGGESLEEQFEMMSTNPDIIVATPGRFLHLKIEMDLDLKTIEYLVFDEADRLFEMGFSEQLSEILRYLPSSRQTSLFSATLPKSLVDFAKAGLQNPILVRLDVESMVSEDLQSAFFSVKSSEKEAALLYLLHDIIKIPRSIQGIKDNNLEENGKDNTCKYNQNTISPYSTIIFTSTRHHVEYLTKLLSLSGYLVSHIYGSLDQTARKNQIASFRAGKTTLLVVTDIAARGIDIPLLSNVINYDFPPKPKIFIHRVGRTARAGQKGWAYSLLKTDDAPYLIELQLFLGKKIVSSNDQDPDYVQNIVLGTFLRHKLEYYCEWIAHVLKENNECYSLKQVMQKGEILYSKTAGSASIESNRRAKELVKSLEWSIINPLLIDTNSEKNVAKEALLAKISNYSPHETIFENSKNFKSNVPLKAINERMKKIRTSKIKTNKSNLIESLFNKKKNSKTNNDTIININNFQENNAEFGSEIIHENGVKNKGNSYKDKENYMSYYTPISSMREHAYDINKSNYSFEKAAKNAIFDLMGDDKDLTNQARAHTNKIRWSFKKKKLVNRINDYNNSKEGSKIIKDESGTKIPATYKTGRYTIWKNSKNITEKKVGEIENCENFTTPKNLHVNPNGRKYKHNKLQAPKAADKYRDDYKKRKKRIQKALEKGYGDNKRVKSELKNIMEIRKIRRLKEKRKQKNARPSKKKH